MLYFYFATPYLWVKGTFMFLESERNDMIYHVVVWTANCTHHIGGLEPGVSAYAAVRIILVKLKDGPRDVTNASSPDTKGHLILVLEST